jgi:tetratricopeptide (TPR) repeat protein
MFSRLRRRLGPELPAAPTPPAAAEPARPIVHAWEPAPEAPIAAHDEAAPPPAWHPAPEAPADHAPPDAEPPEAALTQVEPAPEPAPDLAAVEGTAGIEASSTAEPATIPTPDAILASARAAADTGDTAAAASVLQAGLVLHPAELALHIAYARLAEAHGDWPEAASRWRSLEAAVPDAPDGWLGHAIALQRLGFAAEAEAALQDLIRRFPDQLDALHDLARLAEFRGDWATAERCWLDFHAIETGNWWSHSALASAVMRQGRPDEAEAILQQALTRFPDEPSLLADHARVAESREDWDEAISRWEDVIARAPSHWAGYGGKVAALARLGRQDEANAALLDYGALLPDHPAALHDLGRRAERLQDWPAAEAAWRGFVAQEQRNDWAYQSLAQALVRQDRLDEAEAVLTDAMARLPGSAALAIEAARVSELRGQLDAAAAHWRTASRLAPATADGPIGEASVLSRQGDAAAADAVIEAALARLPAEPALLHAYANTAIAAADWPQALARLQTGQQRFPEVASFGHRIEAIEARLAAEADTPDPTADEAAAEDIRALLLDFESLGGGGGQGGAFARFQRDHGAEPIGLLHWAEALPDELSDALESDFSGIGIPEQTEFTVPPETPRQYRITDRRTGLSMPTFIDADSVPLDEARSLVDQHLGVLRAKLLDDLRQGSRILVYLHGRRSLTAPELDRLHAACRRWSDNTLFYIRHADTLHPVGSVAWAAPGLLVGSLDPADPEVPDTLPAATLLPLCQRAHALWRDRAAALPAAAEIATEA